MNLQENIAAVKENIVAAAKKSGRNPEDITLVAVTKTVDADIMKQAMAHGIDCVGENRVQAFLDKHEQLGDVVDWHIIGHLQTNKVKYIMGKVSLIHSVDSLRLVKEIQNKAHAKEMVQDILLQVNVAQEEGKFGIAVNQVEEFLEGMRGFPNVKLRGLMTIPPNFPNPEENRRNFSKLRQLFVDIREKKYDNIDMDYLSMGMSNDYTIAIEEGANIVRVGSALFQTH